MQDRTKDPSEQAVEKCPRVTDVLQEAGACTRVSEV